MAEAHARRVIAVSGDALIEVPINAPVRAAARSDAIVFVEQMKVLAGQWTVISSQPVGREFEEISTPTWDAALRTAIETSEIPPEQKRRVLDLLSAGVRDPRNVLLLLEAAHNLDWLGQKLAEVLASLGS